MDMRRTVAGLKWAFCCLGFRSGPRPTSLNTPSQDLQSRALQHSWYPMRLSSARIQARNKDAKQIWAAVHNFSAQYSLRHTAHSLLIRFAKRSQSIISLTSNRRGTKMDPPKSTTSTAKTSIFAAIRRPSLASTLSSASVTDKADDKPKRIQPKRNPASADQAFQVLLL
ncbi:hypothetical protein AC578_4745 [Pseudocercospora eumusae]|uniref:Uncharacterized protein n=1 Tax=Pseudocercospora eumusae TaxID=321146 RepID=A0A139HL25_9PEZI|nr:hypothetical protein AC578_4745 [Pseudocercospora eumusae]